jgi:hypothetical protein
MVQVMPHLPALLLLALPARAERIDRVEAVVGDRVVTSWDLRLEEALEGHMPCPEPVLCDPERAPLDRLVDRALVRGLASDTATYRPSTAELELCLATLRDSWEHPEGWQRLLASLGLEERDLSGLLYSRLVVERYVQRHVALPVYASGGGEAEVRARYQEWIRAQRGLVRIRLIDPEGEAPAPEDAELP